MNEGTKTIQISSEQASLAALPTSSSPWWRIADFGVLGVWISIVAFTLRYHEKWADEAQAWLIARDLPLSRIWFYELRYEGAPPLWHTVLWIAQHVFHMRYDSLGLIGMAGATAGVALLIFKAPFPRYIRWPLAFTYFMVYQYAVIARPYTLLPLFAFAAAILFKDLQHPERMTVVLVLLANLSLHGTILAGCFGLTYAMDGWKARATLDGRVRRKYWISIAVMLATFVFIVLILKPTPDVEVFVFKRQDARLLAPQAQIQSTINKLTSIMSGAFLDWFWPSVIFIFLLGAWCFTRRRMFVFLISVGGMIALYSKVQGAPHHHGTAFIAAATALWIAWPNHVEKRRFNVRERYLMIGIEALLLCLCAVNISDAAVAVKRDCAFPYSGSQDTASYLKSVGADRSSIYGLVYGVVAVQAYFDHNIFANIPTAYFHHGLPLDGTNLNIDRFREINPDYVIVYSIDPDSILRTGIPYLTAEGYEIVHFSDGYRIYKRAIYERDVYFILRRVRP